MIFNIGNIVKAKENIKHKNDYVAYKGDQGVVVEITLLRTVQYLTIELVTNKSLIHLDHHSNWLNISSTTDK